MSKQQKTTGRGLGFALQPNISAEEARKIVGINGKESEVKSKPQKTTGRGLISAEEARKINGITDKVESAPTAEQIAADFEARGKAYLEMAKILRGQAKTQ